MTNYTGTPQSNAHAILTMLREAQAARIRRGTVDLKGDEMLARAESGDFGGMLTGGTYTQTVSTGPVIVGVKHAGNSVTATDYKYERPGNGGNGYSNYTAQAGNRATDKQIGFMRSLCAERDQTDALVIDTLATLDTMSKVQATGRIKRLLDMPKVARVVSATPTNGVSWADVKALSATLADKRYAVEGVDGTLDFYRITEKGYLLDVIGGHPDTFVKRSPASLMTILRKIAGADNGHAAMIRYGQEIGRCGHCGRTLTDEESRNAGIGPICASK